MSTVFVINSFLSSDEFQCSPMELCTVESTSEWLCLGESLIRLKLKKINHKLGRVERLYTCAKDSLSFKSFSLKKKKVELESYRLLEIQMLL